MTLYSVQISLSTSLWNNSITASLPWELNTKGRLHRSFTCAGYLQQTWQGSKAYNSVSFTLSAQYLPPANKVWGKVIFSQTSVCPQRGTGSPWQISTGQRPPWTEIHPCVVKSGRYASYWNAFLFRTCCSPLDYWWRQNHQYVRTSPGDVLGRCTPGVRASLQLCLALTIAHR